MHGRRPSCVAIGSIMLDIAVRESVTGQEAFGAWAGGQCGNVAAILSFLGWISYPVTHMGLDSAGDALLKDFERWGVNTSLLFRGPETDTPMIVQKFVEQMHDGFQPDDLCSRSTPQSGHRFSLSCPWCGSRLPRPRPDLAICVEAVVSRVASPDVFFFDEVSDASIALAQIYARTGSLIYFEPSEANESESFKRAACIAHIIKFAADRIPVVTGVIEQCAAPLLIQTRGKAGLAFCYRPHSSDWHELPAYEATVCDTVGSGDWLSAGIIHYLGWPGKNTFSNHSLETVVRGLNFGQALAAINCEYDGARGAMYASSIDHILHAARRLSGHWALAGVRCEPVEASLGARMLGCPRCSR